MSGLVALFAKEQLLVQKPRVTIPLRKASFSFAPSLGFLHQKKIYIFVDARKKVVGCGVVVAAAVKVQKVQKSW